MDEDENDENLVRVSTIACVDALSAYNVQLPTNVAQTNRPYLDDDESERPLEIQIVSICS